MMTTEEISENSEYLLKVATANTKHMAKFVLDHPDIFSEWAVEESKRQLKTIENDEKEKE